jgi:short subunit dehydrogenase-like uncharacterized protein
MHWMIYGANGYTGALIAREAVRRRHRPILAGRSADKIAPLAGELGLEYRVFGLADATAMRGGIDGVALVLHCAGPFSATAAPMMAACLAAKSHYLDITGEISVFEHARTLSAQATAAGIVICPGVGFDVIPTDCVAAALQAALPDATHLALGFDSRSGVSPGTAKTMTEGMSGGTSIRRNGQIVTLPLGSRTRHIDFGNGEKLAMVISWGDISTAFATTGIPNIEVYVPVSPRMISRARLMNHVRWFTSLHAVQSFIKVRIAKSVTGPSETQRAASVTYIWGEVTNAAGQRRTARLTTANGYSLTVTGALAVVEYLATGNDLRGGTFTPVQLAGPDLVTRLPGSQASITIT